MAIRIDEDNLTDGLFRQFEREIKNLGGDAFLSNEADLPEKLNSVLSSRQEDQAAANRKAVIYQTPSIEKLIPQNLMNENENVTLNWLPLNKPPDLNREDYRKMMLDADAGVVAADYLIADSGAIVILGRHHRSQLVTLLPPLLIVLATTRQLVADIHQLHGILHENNQEPDPTIHYIAGPSRTADIEKTLILGVHGPKELYVLVIEDE